MGVHFFDRQDDTHPLNGARIAGREKLLEIVDGLRNRDPFFCELVGENGYSLLLGVGPTSGCAQYCPSDGSTPYLVALGTTERNCNEYVEFLAGDTPSPVPRRFCVPFETAKQIAAHFVETGDRWPHVSWEEI